MADAFKCDNCGALYEGTSSDSFEYPSSDGEHTVMMAVYTRVDPDLSNFKKPDNPFGIQFGNHLPAVRRDATLCRNCVEIVLNELFAVFSAGMFWGACDERVAYLKELAEQIDAK